MDAVSSGDEDDEVISYLSPFTKAQNGTQPCSKNNNNDVGVKKLYQEIVPSDTYAEAAEECKKNEVGQNGHKYATWSDDEDKSCLIKVPEIEHSKEEFQINLNDKASQRVDKEDFEVGKPRQDLENSSKMDPFGACENVESTAEQNTFRKNNTFPIYGNASWLDSIPPLQTPEIGIPHLGKRLLPPIEKVATKKHRTQSESTLDTIKLSDTIQRKSLPIIEGSPAKTAYEEPVPDVRFLIGDDDASDQETYDTSTSSDVDEASPSSSDEKEAEEESEMNDTNISENLQRKLLQVLKFEEFRSKSPTASVSSAPVFPNKKRLSVIDNEDSRSIVSDSKLMRSVSLSEQKRSIVKRRLSSSEDLVIRPIPDDIEYMAEAQENKGLPAPSPLGNKLLDYEDDDVSQSPSIRSTGILPAIPSRGVRERSFLVGNLTKHGSLLGADELNRYFPDRMLRLFVGTWNMQRKGVPRNLNDFLLPKYEDYLQDMYVIGVQESTQDQKKWEIKLQETLGVNHVLAHSVSHGVLHMSIFVRRDLIWFCSPFEDDRVTTRMVSQIKTKGAVAIAFQFFGTSMLFITSHFHSGETRVKERVEDYNRIKEKIKLPKRLQWDTYKSSPEDVTTRFDCTFWFGDLNFRVNMPHQIIHDEVNNPNGYDLKEVLKGDQLLAAMKRGAIFPGFAEPKINFLPTYKFNPGTNKYDTSPKLRVPSYTDRILYKCKETSTITCSRYDSVSTLKKSDHKPVYGFFEVCLKPGRDSIPFGGGKFRNDVYEKAARLRSQQGNYQNNSAVCTIL